MKIIKSILGYILAFLCIPIILAGFIEMDFWSNKLVEMTDVKVAPKYTGGNIINTISNDKYDIQIHRTVFDGLFSESEKGFVQIDFTPLTDLPENIEEEIDYDNDGNKDFKVCVDTNNCTATIESFNKSVVSLEGCYKLKNAIAIRIVLQK